MSREQFDKDLAEAIRKYPAGDCEGWKADFTTSNQISSMVRVKVRLTGNPVALIEAHCQLASTSLPGPDVAQELERVWVSELVFHIYSPHYLQPPLYEREGGYFIMLIIGTKISHNLGAVHVDELPPNSSTPSPRYALHLGFELLHPLLTR